MGEALPRIRERGAELVAIGNGTALMAEDFVEGFSVPFPVYTDPERAAYREAGFIRNFGLGIRTIRRGRRAAREGHSQGRTQGDPWQQGGVLVISPEPRLVWNFVSSAAGDHADVEKVMAALSGSP
jgi:hypothetical protein